MRRLIGLALFATVVLHPVVAAAGGSEGGATIGVSVFLPGFATPSIHWQNPCTGEEYSEYFAGRIEPPNYKDKDTEVTTAQLTNDMGREWAIATYGPDIVNRVVAAQVQYQRYCYDPESRDVDPASWGWYWVPVVSQETVVAALFDHVWDYIEPPAVSWPSQDREYGWLYVKAPMDFRIAPVQAVSLTATVTNITGTVTATVSATPVSVTLEPGEPGALPVVCPVDAATAGYLPETPGLCSYSYRNSSAIAPDAVFGVHASVLWSIETSDTEFDIDSIRTWSSSQVSVAEVQAVVTG